MTFEEQRAEYRRELERANNEDLLRETRSVQDAHPGWSFTDAWDFTLRANPAMRRVDGSGTKDRRVEQELARHQRLGQSRKSDGIAEHVARLAKIRKLQTENPNLTFDAAFTQVCRQENAAKATASTQLKPWNHVPAARPKLVKAKHTELILIRGGESGWFVPLPGTREE